MARYEVFIPADASREFNVTFRVDAENWMAALRTGLVKLGDSGRPAKNLLIDVLGDSSVHVTEMDGGRAFRIRELTDAEVVRLTVKPSPPVPVARFLGNPPSSDEDDTRPYAIPSETPAKPRLALGTRGRAGGKITPTSEVETAPEGVRAIRPEDVAAAEARQRSETPTLRELRPLPRDLVPQTVVEVEAPVAPVPGPIGRALATGDEVVDLLADVFERVRRIESLREPDAALRFLLDLALEKVPAEAGSVLTADAKSGDLSFRVARGPRADEVMRAGLVVPRGVGIAGFCTTEGVSVALSDAHKDARYWAGVEHRVGYEARSVLCSPMMAQGRSFGCFELLNKRDGKPFARHEVGLLAYIAHQGASYLQSIN